MTKKEVILLRSYHPLISVIVPVYNVESYLNRCIESIINQTYKNVDIILVDDGSTDACPAICDMRARLDTRIRVIHKMNGGLSDARNAGIQVAQGDYLLFVDSDDYIDHRTCDILLNALEKTNADIVGCNFYWSYSDGQNIPAKMSLKTPCTLEKIAFFKHFILEGSVDLHIVCGKLYKREVFSKNPTLRFPIGRFHEDEFLNYKLYYAVSTITIIPDILYFYTQRANSIMNNYSIKHILDKLDYIRERLSWALSADKNLYYMIEYSCLSSYFGLLNLLIAKSIRNYDKNLFIAKENQLLNEFNNIYKNPYLKKRDFIKLFLVKHRLFLPLLKIKQGIKSLIWRH